MNGRGAGEFVHTADERVNLKHTQTYTPTHTHIYTVYIETTCRLPLGGESWEQKTKGRRKRRALDALGGVGVTESSEGRESRNGKERKKEKQEANENNEVDGQHTVHSFY